MRKINRIIIHCSATKERQDFDVEDIRRWHLANGWTDVGYHYVIKLNGEIQEGRPIEKTGAHTKDFNKDSIGICYIGGCDKNGNPKDTRTKEQKKALYSLVKELMARYGVSEVKGHRDYSPDKNHDGKITQNEWIKACPSFDVQQWMKEVGLAKWKHFSMKEFTESDTAEKLEYKNVPLQEHVENINRLVTNVLDPLREKWGSPIKVTSGYRVPRLNEAVGGAKNSQHLEGKAADIQPMKRPFDEFKAFVLDWLKGNTFDKCIVENGWIHISYDAENNRRIIE